jgi:hypothetical protein
MEGLRRLERREGCFCYRAGGEGLTEVTCLAILAFRAMGFPRGTVQRSLDWLRGLQREDGGIAPQASVAESNWVTSLGALAFGVYSETVAQRRALEWVLRLSGEESGWQSRALRAVLGIKPPYPVQHRGWPWVKGSAAWLMPTSLAVLALETARQSGAFPALAEALTARFEEGRAMIVDRRCADGGWNHGAPTALDVPATSYPETTGMALLALQSLPADRISGADALGVQMLSTSHTANAVSWLQLGLQARQQPCEIGEETAIQCRNGLDYALRILALQAAAGNNVFKV